MRFINTNHDSDIEVLRHQMDRAINRKNMKIAKIDIKISDAEDEAMAIRKKQKWLDKYIGQLRQEREIEEIKCFREILEIHKEIIKISEHHLNIKTK